MDFRHIWNDYYVQRQNFIKRFISIYFVKCDKLFSASHECIHVDWLIELSYLIIRDIGKSCATVVSFSTSSANSSFLSLSLSPFVHFIKNFLSTRWTQPFSVSIRNFHGCRFNRFFCLFIPKHCFRGVRAKKIFVLEKEKKKKTRVLDDVSVYFKLAARRIDFSCEKLEQRGRIYAPIIKWIINIARE